ncbi:MAG: zf-HC2 domain-containing protein [Phycisphaeraceae bacterium]|nr:zf-HC2 domain-containing protein [Phycisphaeraceae bacterium]
MSSPDEYASCNGSVEPDRDLSIPALLRAAADSELSPAERARLEAHLAAEPADRQRIEFDRHLRHAVARVMTAPTAAAPLAFRNRLSEALAATPQIEAQTQPLSDSPAIAGHISRADPVDSIEDRRRRLSANWWWAAAAVLAVAGVSATILLTRAPAPEPEKPRIAIDVPVPTPAVPPAEAAYDGVVPLKYLANAHRKFDVTDPKAISSLQRTDPVEVSDDFRKYLGRHINIDDIERLGFVFRGSMPVEDGRVYHYVFGRKVEGAEDGAEERLSLFIEKETGAQRFTEGIAWSTRAGPADTDSPHVLAWCTEGMVYFLVTETPETQDLARQELHGPDTVAPL